jgi:hypothetical protein
MDARTTSLRCLAIIAALAAAPLVSGCVAEVPDELADESEGLESPEPVDTVDEAVTGSTVLQAADSSCSTTSVKGLSLQIINEGRCLNAEAFVPITKTSNVTFGSAVFAYLEKPARDKLVAALKANPSRTMTVNSALRTVAQQYLLYRWFQQGRCSIKLAAKPGTSNHETGLALDVSQFSAWKTTLQNSGFTWLGSGDPVHFDYTGTGAKSYKGLDVKAFQRLWNRNHPGDLISVDGAWGPQTEARMKKSPAGGFAKGPTCGTALQYEGPEGEADTQPQWTDEENERYSPDDADYFLGLAIEDGEHEHAEETCSDSAL